MTLWKSSRDRSHPLSVQHIRLSIPRHILVILRSGQSGLTYAIMFLSSPPLQSNKVVFKVDGRLRTEYNTDTAQQLTQHGQRKCGDCTAPQSGGRRCWQIDGRSST